MNSPGHDNLRGLALPQYAGHIAMGGFFNFGNAGVDFFFIPLLRLARTRAVLNPMALS